jgi:FeS assembly SUF system regulator
MIRITKQADYGVVLMTFMTQREEDLFKASELAAETGLPLPTVSKILKLLTRGGLLVSHRGVKGGYTLGRMAEEISVAEIVAALDGPIAVTECIEQTPGECSRESRCVVRGNWQRINLAIHDALESISLAEMAAPAVARLEEASELVTLGSR